MIVHGPTKTCPSRAVRPTAHREVAVEAATYEGARVMPYEQVRDEERLIGIRVEGRAETYGQSSA